MIPNYLYILHNKLKICSQEQTSLREALLHSDTHQPKIFGGCLTKLAHTEQIFGMKNINYEFISIFDPSSINFVF